MQKQKYISKKWFILLAIVLFIIPMVAYAQPDVATVTGQATGVFNTVLQNMVTFLSKVLELLQKILWPIFLAIGGLMGNDLLFGSGMEERLLDIWTQIRNLVNIGFVVILLGIALYNVTGFAQENYQLKTFLPKFIVALLLVNFTFIGLKFVLDVSNVLTHVVFTLPSSISAELQGTQIYLPVSGTDEYTEYVSKNNLSNDDVTKIESNIDRVCKSMFGNTNDFEKKVNKLKQASTTDPNQDPSQFYCQVSGSKYTLTKTGRDFFRQYTSRNSALILAVQMMKIVDINKLSEALEGENPSISKLTFNLLFSVIMYLVYGVAYVVLFVVLLARLVFLWVIIALSPLIAVKIVFPNLPMGDKDYFKEFLKNAFVPALIGIPLTVGYIMLGALSEANQPITNDFDWKIFNVETSGISDLQSLVIAFGAVAVVWMGVFAAAQSSIAGNLVQTIRGKLEGAGRALARSTRFLPLIPAGAGPKGRVSYQQVSNLFSAPLRRLQEKYGGQYQGRTITRANIEALGRRGRAGSPQELKQYLAQGITTPRFRQPLGRVVKQWKQGSVEQKRLRTDLITLLGGGTVGRQALGRLEQGRLTRAEARKVQQWAQNQLPPTSPGATAGARRPGARPTTAAGKAQTERETVAGNITDSKNLGYVDDKDVTAMNQYAGKKEFNDYIKSNKDRMKVYAAISASKTHLGSAQSSAGQISGLKSVTKETVEPIANNLKTQISASKRSLQKQGLNKDQIKAVLTKVVEDKFGDNKDKFYGTKSGEAIRDLIQK